MIAVYDCLERLQFVSSVVLIVRRIYILSKLIDEIRLIELMVDQVVPSLLIQGGIKHIIK